LNAEADNKITVADILAAEVLKVIIKRTTEPVCYNGSSGSNNDLEVDLAFVNVDIVSAKVFFGDIILNGDGVSHENDGVKIENGEERKEISSVYKDFFSFLSL